MKRRKGSFRKIVFLQKAVFAEGGSKANWENVFGPYSDGPLILMMVLNLILMMTVPN